MIGWVTRAPMRHSGTTAAASSEASRAGENISQSPEYSTHGARKLARPERFELPTFWFVGWRSLARNYSTRQAFPTRDPLNIFTAYPLVTA